MERLAFLDATAQAAMAGRGELEPDALVHGAVTRILRLNPTLNAVAQSFFEGDVDLRSSRPLVAALSGVPTLVDPPAPGPEAERLYDPGKGLVVVGVGNLSGARVRNPWDISRTAGAGSAGAAAAVAAGLVPVAHGRSVLAPAASCGVLGFQPAAGGPMGVVARTVRDLALFLPDCGNGAPRALRIAVDRRLPPDPDCAAALEKALRLCQQLGHLLVDEAGGCDLWLSPALSEPPPPLDDAAGPVAAERSAGPALTLPLYWTARGLPVGAQFTGRPGAEAALLGLAAQLEAASPWASLKPPVHA